MKSQQQDTTILEQIIEPKVEDTLEKVIAKKTTSQIIDSTVANIVNDTNTNTVEAIKFDSATVVKADNYTQFFETHHLQPKVYFTRTRTEPTPDWYTVVLLVIVVFITIIKVYYARVFEQLIKSFYSSTTANQVVREENMLVQRATVVLNVVSYIVMALFIYRVSEYYLIKPEWMGKGFVKFIFFAVMVSIAYSAKMFFVKALGILFNMDKPAATYIYNLFLVNIILGLLLLPLLILISYVGHQYVPYLVLASVLLAIIMFGYRTVKTVQIWIGLPEFSFYYLILYLCAFEILPIMIIARLASVI